MKKDNLLKGTLILALSALIARFLGIFQKIPLDYIVGDDGNIYFGVANSVYMYLLIIATAGFPSAISKMISERHALNKISEAQKIYRAAMIFGITSGLILSVTLYMLAPYYATYVTQTPGAYLSIRAIAPALLFFPLIAIMRGYFQGRRVMMPVGLSQIIEQILRVVLGLLIALLVFSLGWGDGWVSAAATFGSVLGALGALTVLLLSKNKIKDNEEVLSNKSDDGSVKSFKSIYKEIFSLSIPVVITSMTVQFFYLVDSSFFMRFTDLYYDNFSTAKNAMSALIFNAQSIAGIPPIIAIALSQSIIPILSAASTLGDKKEVNKQATLVFQVFLFIGMPASFIMGSLSYSINGLLFSSSDGGGIVGALTFTSFIQIGLMISNSILLGIGQPRPAMMHTLVGFAVKIISSFLLGSFLGAYGLVMASLLSFLVVTTLNIRVISKSIQITNMSKNWIHYVGVVCFITLLAFTTDTLVRFFFNAVFHSKLLYLFSLTISSVVSLVVYIILVKKIKLFNDASLSSLPAPMRKLVAFIGLKEKG
ncbi:polysaccharide biosynthesis protein [Paenibacillus sp. FSL R7-0652]|uniref:putative polysaccharide biosynthesis protein n=1 Tax=Paenibacillus sp. FSL R7-0652 TaxID=2921687 RepID=UPI003159CAE6